MLARLRGLRYKKAMKHCSLPVFSLALALLLSSCTLHIGERIRGTSELHVGAAKEHATVKFYHPDAREFMREYPTLYPDYVLAPEVTYRIRRPILDFGYTRTPVDITPTGRMVYVEPEESQRVEEEAVKGYIRVPQQTVSSKDYASTYTDARQLGDFETPVPAELSLGARIAAAPFDYAIDPVLTAVSTTALGCAECASVLVACPFLCVYNVLTAGPVEHPGPSEPTN